MLVITIRIMGRANTLKTEGLVLKAMHMDHMGMGHQAELSIISICTVWAKRGEAMHIVGPRSHKATKGQRFRGNAWEDIKGVGWNDIGELRDNGRGRWGCIPGIGGGVSIGGGRKSRGRLRM
jgi:hypothetical protein